MYCILISGIPASGKSTAARLISKNLAIPYFSKDEIKERLFDTVGFSSRAGKVKLNLGATSVAYYIAEQLMRSKIPFVLENNFENETAEDIKALIESYSFNAISVALTGDYHKVYERFCARQNSPERHRGHVVNDCYPEINAAKEAPQMSYESYVDMITSRGMDKFRIDGENIVVDTTDIDKVDWNELFERLKAIIKDFG